MARGSEGFPLMAKPSITWIACFGAFLACSNLVDPCADPGVRGRCFIARSPSPSSMHMASRATMKRLVSVISIQFNVGDSEVRPESLFWDLARDSLDVVDALLAIEDEFDVELTEDRTSKLIYVQDIANLVDEKLQERTLVAVRDDSR